jgi:hypothetical protein
MVYLLAQQFAETSPEEFKQGYGGLIFMALFFLGLIILGIWWLKRGA